MRDHRILSDEAPLERRPTAYGILAHTLPVEHDYLELRLDHPDPAERCRAGRDLLSGRASAARSP